jgi:hypothetical protein
MDKDRAGRRGLCPIRGSRPSDLQTPTARRTGHGLSGEMVLGHELLATLARDRKRHCAQAPIDRDSYPKSDEYQHNWHEIFVDRDKTAQDQRSADAMWKCKPVLDSTSAQSTE